MGGLFSLADIRRFCAGKIQSTIPSDDSSTGERQALQVLQNFAIWDSNDKLISF